MKKQITRDDLKQLTETGRKNYRNYWRPTVPNIDDLSFDELPLMTIGDMVEFLRSKTTVTIYMNTIILGVAEDQIEYDDLCEGLWIAVLGELA